MSYPDKYCNKCERVTERYSQGHCKECVKKRNKLSNDLRKDKYNKHDTIYKKYGKIRKPNFKKESYKRLTIESVIKEFARNKYYFIYFLINNNKVVYIGQSNKNVLSRISSHLQDKTFNQVYYKAFGLENVMDEYEKKFIIKYRPKYNKEVIYEGIKYAFFDLKTEQTIQWTIKEATEVIECNRTTVLNLLYGNSKSIYKRYVLECNKPEYSSYKNVLDTKTGEIKRHNYITFAEELGVKQNKVWYFMNGFNKSYCKKRYVIV